MEEAWPGLWAPRWRAEPSKQPCPQVCLPHALLVWVAPQPRPACLEGAEHWTEGGMPGPPLLCHQARFPRASLGGVFCLLSEWLRGWFGGEPMWEDRNSEPCPAGLPEPSFCSQRGKSSGILGETESGLWAEDWVPVLGIVLILPYSPRP